MSPPSPQWQIRLVVEEGLNQLPYSECTVTTPTGEDNGLKFEMSSLWSVHINSTYYDLANWKNKMYHWVGLLLIQLCTCFLLALGYKYEGVKFERGNCGVSIMRSGEFKPAVPHPPSQVLLLWLQEYRPACRACTLHTRCRIDWRAVYFAPAFVQISLPCDVEWSAECLMEV